jgi:DNA-binding transcriptional ArsR family regulator
VAVGNAKRAKEAEDTREAVDLRALNAESVRIVARQAALREAVDVIAGVNDGVDDGVNDGAKIRLDATDRAILAALLQDGTHSAADLAMMLGKSLRTLERHLAKLTGAGLLLRKGSDKTGVRVVTEGRA